MKHHLRRVPRRTYTTQTHPFSVSPYLHALHKAGKTPIIAHLGTETLGRDNSLRSAVVVKYLKVTKVQIVIQNIEIMSKDFLRFFSISGKPEMSYLQQVIDLVLPQAVQFKVKHLWTISHNCTKYPQLSNTDLAECGFESILVLASLLFPFISNLRLLARYYMTSYDIAPSCPHLTSRNQRTSLRTPLLSQWFLPASGTRWRYYCRPALFCWSCLASQFCPHSLC